MAIQFRVLREALAHAGRSAKIAEETTARVRAELHAERTKSSCFQFTIEELTKKLNAAIGELGQITEENKRLRTNVGELCAERDELAKSSKKTWPNHEEAPESFTMRFENLRDDPEPEPAPTAPVESKVTGFNWQALGARRRRS
jgi:chromosome segregation ATPase